jgi:hypothetical protein
MKTNCVPSCLSLESAIRSCRNHTRVTATLLAVLLIVLMLIVTMFVTPAVLDSNRHSHQSVISDLDAITATR